MKNQQKTISRKTLLKSILTLSSIGLIASGAATGIILSTSRNAKLNNTQAQTNKVMGKYCRDTSNGSNITQTQLIDHVKAVSDKLQLQLKAAWVDDTAIAQIVGTFKANLNSFQPEINNDCNDKEQETLNQKYAYLNEQAKNLGIEVVDFDAYQKSVIPQTHAYYVEDLMNAGVDKNAALQAADQMSNLQLALLSQAQTQLYSDLDLALAMANIQSMSSFDVNAIKSKGKVLLSSEESKDRLIDTQLHAVLNYANTILNTRLIVQDNDKFIPTLKDYSATGKYQSGDVIDQIDLKSLFNFTYNSTYGGDLSQYTIDDLPATIGGEYDNGVINAISVNAPLGTYENEFASYEYGDIIPGYQLRAKIVSMDDITDSHQCKISLLFGVSRDSEPDKVIWQEDNGKKFTDESNVNNITLSVRNNNDRAYIAQHKYYVDQQPANIAGNYVPDHNGSWFDDTVNQRNKIEVVLAKAFVNPDTGEYDFVNHPLLLDDTADIAGIPSADNLDLKATFHTNQTIKLKVSYANTNADGIDNLSYLTMNYCYVDDNFAVKDIPWHIDGKTYSTLNIKYEMSQEIKDDISIATSDIDMIESYKYGIENYTNISADDLKQSKTLYNDNVGFNAAEIATNGLLALTLVTYGIVIGISFGADGDAVKNAAICGVAIAINVACLVVTTLLLNGEKKMNTKFTNIRNAAIEPEVKTIINDSFTNIQTYKDHITDPLYNIVGKDQDCKKVMQIKADTFKSNKFDPLIEIMGKDNNWDPSDIERVKQGLRHEGDPSSAANISYDTLSVLSFIGSLTSFAYSYWGLNIVEGQALCAAVRQRTACLMCMDAETGLTSVTGEAEVLGSQEEGELAAASRESSKLVPKTSAFNKMWGKQIQALLLFTTAFAILEPVIKYLVIHFNAK